jgi:hypothetical protein
MTELIEAIDDYTADYFSSYNLKNWGFCELMKKSAGEGSVEQPMPVTIPLRKQVSLMDTYEIITWIRQTSPVQYEPNEEWSFGKNEARFANLPLRIVFCNKVSLANSESLVYEYLQNFPSKLSVADYQFIFVGANSSVDPDHEAIYTTELGNNSYEKHRFPWNLYAINLNVQFIICQGDYRLTESGDFRVLE